MKTVPRIEEGVRSALEAEGAALLRLADAAAEASASPWTFAERLFGERVVMVERQPIRAVRGGTTFASSNAFTPFHTDSQLHFGVPPSAQVLVCRRPAERGGQTTLVDAWELVGAIDREDRALGAWVFDELRTHRFYFGDFSARTIARRRGHVFFTHAPFSAKGDAMAARLGAILGRATQAVVALSADEVLVANNHRLLHGRLAFDGADREMVRLLVWLAAPWAVPDEILRRVREDEPVDDPMARSRRLAVVLELLRGVPPGVLAARERIPEADLYRWRDAALAGAARALRE